MLIVKEPITLKFRTRKQTSKPQPNQYHSCVQFSFLTPYWLYIAAQQHFINISGVHGFVHFTVILLYGLLTVRFFIYSKLLLEEGGYCGIKKSNTGLSLRFQVARYMKLFVLTGNLAARTSSMFFTLRKQATFGDATTGFPAK